MNYRKLGRTGIMVSEIGLGSEGFMHRTEEEAIEFYDAALEMGINFFDLYNSEPDVRDHLGVAMKGRRDKFIIQAQFGSAWVDGQYKRVRDIESVREAGEDLFKRLGTDYLDIGMIHYCDEQKDYDVIFGHEFEDYMKGLKSQGRIGCIGFGTHNVKMAMQAAKTGFIDVILLSINPAYDMLPPNEDIDLLFKSETYQGEASVLNNIDPEREELYAYCESNEIALTVMKPYAGGALLKAEESPFGAALSVAQCLHYCLTRPGVSSVCSGAHNIEELREAAEYSDLAESKKEYATVLSSAPAHGFKDKCMYCGHCAPCTMGIDIAMVNKFADLCKAQKAVPETVRDHYALLSHKASECIACGICEGNCPFGVKIIEHMTDAVRIFGE